MRIRSVQDIDHSCIQFKSNQRIPCVVRFVICRDVAAFAWGDDIVFTDATVVANKPEAAGLNIVTVNVGTDISSGYDKAGQFIQMKVCSWKLVSWVSQTNIAGRCLGRTNTQRCTKSSADGLSLLATPASPETRLLT